MGRKTKLNQAVIREICTAISANNRPVVAAASAGIPERTFYEWKKRGEEDDIGIYRDLVDEMGKAKAGAEIRNMATIVLASPKYWQAAAWILERTMPNEYGQRPRRDAQGAGRERDLMGHQAWRRARLKAQRKREAERPDPKT